MEGSINFVIEHYRQIALHHQFLAQKAALALIEANERRLGILQRRYEHLQYLINRNVRFLCCLIPRMTHIHILFISKAGITLIRWTLAIPGCLSKHMISDRRPSPELWSIARSVVDGSELSGVHGRFEQT